MNIYILYDCGMWNGIFFPATLSKFECVKIVDCNPGTLCLITGIEISELQSIVVMAERVDDG